jgi:hypothetical protein
MSARGGGAGRVARAPKGSVVPPAEFRSYYGRPIIAEPAWTWEVPWYFFFGGMAGASAMVATAARRTGRPRLAQAARRIAVAGAAVSPPLLIADLGRPERFHHMLRVFKPTSPLSVGSWILAAFAPAAIGAGVLAEAGRLPRLQRAAELAATALAPGMMTYTAALVATTAVPVWSEARRELPAVFVGSAAASAGAAVSMLVPGDEGRPARRLAVEGAVMELAATAVMEHRLGDLGEPYHQGDAGRWASAARGLTAGGAVTMAVLGRRRRASVLGALLLLGGSLAQRWAVYRAGFQSARDPKYTVALQRRRMNETPATR